MPDPAELAVIAPEGFDPVKPPAEPVAKNVDRMIEQPVVPKQPTAVAALDRAEPEPAVPSAPLAEAILIEPSLASPFDSKEAKLPAPADPIDDSNAAVRLTRLYFGNNPVGDNVGPIEPWPEHEELHIQAPPAADPDFKRSAVTPAPEPTPEELKSGDVAPLSGETVAPKGQVTGPGKSPEDSGRTPRARRQRACQGREVPRGRGLFRIARRTQARPDRGRASGDEPGVLRLLSEQRLRRGLSERASQIRLPVHIRLRQHRRTS